MVRLIVDSRDTTTLAGDLDGIAGMILREELSGSYMDSSYTFYKYTCKICGAGIDCEEAEKVLEWALSLRSDMKRAVHAILNQRAGDPHTLDVYCMRCIEEAHLTAFVMGSVFNR